MPKPETDADQPAGHDHVLAALEAAWERWVSGLEVGDAKLRSVLRGAFAAGYEAGHDAATRR